MKHSFLGLVVLIILCVACGGEPTEVTETLEIQEDTIPEIDSSFLYPLDGTTYTAEAAIDGPDDELWVFQPGAWEGIINSPIPDSYDILHVIPHFAEGGEIKDEMSNLNTSNFHLYGEFTTHTGQVIFYFDRLKKHVAAQFYVLEGKPDGVASIYAPDGSIYIQRRYKKGLWVESIVAPYSCDWTFTQKESKLRINDPNKSAGRNERGELSYTLTPSMREQEPGDNNSLKILEKASYQNPFQINDKVFTGTLYGNREPIGIMRVDQEYILNFKEGWLHGDVKLYNWWGDLVLHEIFDMGELDTTVYEMDESEMDGMAKPIIYLYPEKDTKVHVELAVKGELTHTYPKYNNGWNVLAKPDGTLFDEKGKEYYALYWEGLNEKEFTIQEGFVIKGSETAEFLELALDELGLNRREANEFIVYWLPILEVNPYNLIHFSTDEYQDIARLKIIPKPETLIRVMMVYKPLQTPVTIRPQQLPTQSIKRKGFTVVEWGGSLYSGEPTLMN